MLSIDNKDALDYCKKSDNTLAAAVTFSLSGNNLTITDGTTYASGDARSNVNLEIFDGNGIKKDAQITGADVDHAVTVDLAAAGLNKAEGISINATVVSNLGKIKDGSVVKTFASSGALTMEK